VPVAVDEQIQGGVWVTAGMSQRELAAWHVVVGSDVDSQ
jgi:hypothetical protein